MNDGYLKGKFSPHFDAREFIHPDVWHAFGWPRSRWFISDFMVNYAELLRKTLNSPILICDWHERKGGTVGRGYRPPTYRPLGGAKFSQHYLCKAVDVSCPVFKPRQIFQAIMDNRADFEAVGLTTIEDVEVTKTWLHGDCRARIEGLHPKEGFLIVKP